VTWYANGTLTEAERKQVDAAIAVDPRGQSLLSWETDVRAVVRENPALTMPANHGLERVMQRIHAEIPAKRATPRQAQGNWFSRLSQYLTASPAFSFACAIMLIQFGVIAYNQFGKADEKGYSEVRAVTFEAAQYDTFLKVSFRQDTRESDLRLLTRTINANIVAGPSQLGDYYLLVSKDEAATALSALRASSHVASADIVNALPTRQ
jgi:hypothetical protein